MGRVDSENMKKHICIGILAHVDAGKTTLSEGILYQTGTIRRLGRVDNKDAFLDTYELERARGITIFSKQAVFDLGDLRVTLLDTPGHVDFSAEMERTLQVLDCAVLVVSGADGVQGHTETLWQLLKRYKVPVFVFVNKMDQSGTDWQAVLADMRKRLDANCVPFNGLETERPASAPRQTGRQEGGQLLADIASHREETMEELAVCDESVLETYLEEGTVSRGDICRMIAGRQVFPCYFGSALKLWGVEELLQGLEDFGADLAVGDVVYFGRKSDAGTAGCAADFGARVFKISRDDQGNRLTHMKITGGVLKVKDTLPYAEGVPAAAGRKDGQGLAGGDGGHGRIGGAAADADEKVNQIRIYSGAKYETVAEAGPGTVCAVTGPVSTYAGQYLGTEAGKEGEMPLLEPVLTYQVILPPGCDLHGMLVKLR